MAETKFVFEIKTGYTWTAKRLVEGVASSDAKNRDAALGDLLAFVKEIDEAVGEWSFTLALCDHFAKLRDEHREGTTGASGAPSIGARIERVPTFARLEPPSFAMGAKCGACGHQHGGPDVAFICIGCPCEARPQ